MCLSIHNMRSTLVFSTYSLVMPRFFKSGKLFGFLLFCNCSIGHWSCWAHYKFPENKSCLCEFVCVSVPVGISRVVCVSGWIWVCRPTLDKIMPCFLIFQSSTVGNVRAWLIPWSLTSQSQTLLVNTKCTLTHTRTQIFEFLLRSLKLKQQNINTHKTQIEVTNLNFKIQINSLLLFVYNLGACVSLNSNFHPLGV